MKKVLLSAFIIAGMLATSCKKERTCTCKWTDGTVIPATFKDTKKKAEDACDALQTTWNIGVTDPADQATCTLD